MDEEPRGLVYGSRVDQVSGLYAYVASCSRLDLVRGDIGQCHKLAEQLGCIHNPAIAFASGSNPGPGVAQPRMEAQRAVAYSPCGMKA